MKHLTKIAKASLIVFFGSLLLHLLNYLYRLIISRIGVAEYGMYNLGLVLYNLAITLSLLGIHYGILRYIPYYRSRKNLKKAGGVISTAIKINFSLSIILALLILLLAPQISIKLFHNSLLTPILRFFALLLPITILIKIFFLGVQAFQRIDYVMYSSIIFDGLLKVLLAFLLIALGFGLFGAILAFALPLLFSLIISFYFLKKLIPSMSLQLPIDKELLLYSSSMMLVYIANTAIQWIDVVMLGYLKTSYEVGIYSVALPTASLIFMIPYSITSLFLPIVTSLFTCGRSISQIYKTTTRWIFYTTFPFALFIAIFSKQVISLLFGREYLPASLPLAILTASFMLNSLFFPGSYVLMMLKKTRLLVLISSVTALLSLILNYLLIPAYGINGAAIATGLSLIFAGIVTGFCSYRLTRIDLFSKSHTKVALLGVITILATYFFSAIFSVWNFRYSIIFLFAIFLFIYFFLLILFKCIEKEDKNVLLSIKRAVRVNIPILDEFLG